ncbi:hypothetical protein ACPW96_20260 [Micromonospora sp. DT81.3]
MVLLNLVLALAAIASAVFAFVQAKSATDSRLDAQVARDESREARDESERLAGEANEAFTRQADAQEEANRLRKAEMTPPDWSGPTLVSGQLYRVTNTSERTLTVTEFEVTPDGAANRLGLRNRPDGRYEHGDSFQFMVSRAFGGNPEKLTVVYTHEDQPEISRFVITL